MTAPRDPAAAAWRSIQGLVFDHDRRREVSAALDLSFGRIRLLRRVGDEGATLRELASRLGADPPYVTLMVADLEERGLVVREAHPTDRRAKLVRLTDAGRQAAAEAQRLLDEPPAALRTLPSEDLAELARILGRL